MSTYASLLELGDLVVARTQRLADVRHRLAELRTELAEREAEERYWSAALAWAEGEHRRLAATTGGDE